jgi:virginiamycin B lyase
MRNLMGAICGLLTVLTSAAPAVAGGDDFPGAQLTEWQVPWENTRPRDPWVGAPDRIWFVGQRADYLAWLNPQTGEFRRFPLESGAGPHTVIADERGAWYAGNRAQHIGRLEPGSGAIDKIMLPGDGPRDAHTMDFTSDGDIWFTVQGGNQIGLLETDNGNVTLLDVETPRARPYGILVDDDDQPWAVLFGTNRLATVDPEMMAVREIELPRSETRPRRLAITADRRVWYVDYAAGWIGFYDPSDGDVREWRTPSGSDSRPYAMAADAEGRLWFVETGVQPNRFVGFDPRTERFSEAVEIDSGGGTVRHMVYHAPDNAIWFGTDTNTIGRADLP